MTPIQSFICIKIKTFKERFGVKLKEKYLKKMK